jgi:hypothetical protein
VTVAVDDPPSYFLCRKQGGFLTPRPVPSLSLCCCSLAAKPQKNGLKKEKREKARSHRLVLHSAAADPDTPHSATNTSGEPLRCPLPPNLFFPCVSRKMRSVELFNGRRGTALDFPVSFMQFWGFRRTVIGLQRRRFGVSSFI